MNAAWTKYLPGILREKLDGRQQLQKAIGNSGWLMFEKILRMGVGLFVNVWIARYLGPENFGLLSYALAFAGLFVPLVTLGLDEIVVRNVVRDPENKDETLGTAFAVKLAGGFAAFAAATATAMILRPADSLTHWLVGIIAAGSLFQSLNIIDIWFNSQVQTKYAVLARNAAFALCTIIRVLLILTRAPLTAFAIVVTIETVIAATGLLVAYRATGGSFKKWHATFATAKNLLRDSLPLALSFVSVGIYQRIDQVMLQEMSGSHEVGIYAVAVRLSEVWIFIPNAIYWSVYPSIVKAKQVSDELFYERLQKFYNLVALLAYAIAIPMTLCSQWLVDSLFGEAYTRAGLMVTWLIWAHLFTSLEIARSTFLASMNWYKIYFISALAGCILNIVLCYFLIPRYGGMGAVVASIFAYWFAGHGSCFLFKSTFRTGAMISKAIIYPKIW
ncbi:flippase [Geomobilimonas luticola]|uniref:Flippase n=1 Tax=Geomobilimonas luticola TaxID=1114878 RepID=A0ABS5SH61_9BACT|nr:flippase [Geomobilimonas luticola]MBT0653849.1 flippase [Geomobilimonas luticola]